MANETRESLNKRIRNAIFQEALFRPESALVIAATLLLSTASAIFPDFLGVVPIWGWLVGGAIAEGALIGAALTDPEFGRKVAAKVLQHEYRPERLKDKYLQQRLAEAFDYRSRIEAGIRQRSNSVLKDELIETATQIDDWLENIYDLALRIDRYQQDATILDRDRKRAEARLQQLQAELSATQNTAVRDQVQDTMQGLQRQLQTLDALENTIKRARLQLESSLTHLGTIYSQTMLVDVKDIDRARARRLRQEIADEVTELNDLLGSMDEVYSAEAF